MAECRNLLGEGIFFPLVFCVGCGATTPPVLVLLRWKTPTYIVKSGHGAAAAVSVRCTHGLLMTIATELFRVNAGKGPVMLPSSFQRYYSTSDVTML